MKEFTFSENRITTSVANAMSLLDRTKQNSLDRKVYGFVMDEYTQQMGVNPMQTESGNPGGTDTISQWLEMSTSKVDDIGKLLLGYTTGWEISNARTKLDELRTDIGKMYKAIDLFSGCENIKAFIHGFRADDPVIVNKWDELQTTYSAFKTRTDNLFNVVNDYNAARDVITANPDECYGRLCGLQQAADVRAENAYKDMQVLDARYDIDGQVETNPLAALESESENLMEFAQNVAMDETVKEEELKDYLFLKALQMIKFNEDERLWVERKWRDRLDDINNFIDMCMRLCNQKIHSWTRIIALIHSYLTEVQKVIHEGTTSRRYYIMYMQKHFSLTGSPDIRSVTTHFTVDEDDKKEWYPHFNTLFATAVTSNTTAVA